MNDIGSAIVAWKWTRTLVCGAVLSLTTAFVRAPHARWALGEVADLRPDEKRLVLRQPDSRKHLSLHWDKRTRLWVEPTRPNDRGTTFRPADLPLGTSVRVMFKDYHGHSVLMRVIRLGPVEAVREKALHRD